MIAFTDGSSSFSRATQSTPDMFGSWMSINTSSGTFRGSTCKASSAVEQVQMQRKSGDRLTIVSNPSRVVLLSSTMATLIMQHTLHTLERQAEFDGGSPPRLAVHITTAAEFQHPLFHAREAVPSGLA